jgi:hypothetical protein
MLCQILCGSDKDDRIEVLMNRERLG